jgi:TolB-like protein/class 3 adenylate cyclase
MAEESFKRKLTTMFSADVVGYSRLMAEDEAATVKTLKAYRKILTELIKQHRGRVVDSPGDNLLAEFTSVVDAVQCAVAVQKELQARNAELPKDLRMEFRIGVNLGDVIEEEERIYGDGVNIAARLEALADPGGVCISKTAFDQIETKLPLGYENLGEQTVKNIAKPVGAYRVLMEPRVTGVGVGEEKRAWLVRRKAILAGAVAVLVLAIAVVIWNYYLRGPRVEPASEERMAYPLPDKLSIAVLPFENMSGDPEQDYIADGITENIITGLSKTPQMFVIARNSVFTYKGKPVKIRQVSEELGVQYVLEGSVQKEGERVRITAQLVDALKGHHLWAEQYDRELKELFALQDEITMKILTALEVKLTEGLQALVYHRTTENLDAYVKVLKGREYIYTHDPENLTLARQILQEAVALDPEYLVAWRHLAVTYLMEVWLGVSGSPGKSIERAEELAQKILFQDDTDAEAYQILGQIYLVKGQLEESAAAFRMRCWGRVSYIL